MSRRPAFGVLTVALALVAATLLAFVGGVVAGAWRPAGPPHATPSPTPASVDPELGAFLDEVRAGLVVAVELRGTTLSVDGVDRDYSIELPDESVDIYGAMAAAADDGGVPVPEFTMAGPEPVATSYEEFLELVRAGEVPEVFHEGDTLSGYLRDGNFQTTVPTGVDDVLADIEAAADAGGFPPPVYTKAPTPPE